jgi:hypothetical protein
MRDQEVPRGQATLQAALDAARDGDAIEVRTDGPFPGALLKAPQRGGRLSVRAAPGYRPVVNSLLRLELPKADVEIEGLAFWPRGPVLTGDYGRLTLRNCAFQDGDVTVNCVFHGPGQAGRFINSLFPPGPACSVGPGQGILVENCVVRRPSINARNDDDCELVLRHCLCWAWESDGSVSCDGNPKSRPRVHADDTAFVGGAVLSWSGARARWGGAHNLYSLTLGFAVSQPIYTLEAWQQRWGSDHDSLFTPSPLLEPRLRSIAAGPPKRSDGKDYGADVDRVARTAAP